MSTKCNPRAEESAVHSMAAKDRSITHPASRLGPGSPGIVLTRVSGDGMQKTRDGVPAYQRIQNAIRKRIESGHLRPRDSVDSERDLPSIHQVSLMTAHHALVGATPQAS